MECVVNRQYVTTKYLVVINVADTAQKNNVFLSGFG